MELTDGEFKKVEEIFQKCLPVAWTVDMFNFYLDYIRRMNNVLTGGEQARTTISQAYEFVISVVGIDKDSGSIWADYLDFVKSSQVLPPPLLRVYTMNVAYNRPTQNGKNSRKWIKRERYISAQFVCPSKIWKHSGRATINLKMISTNPLPGNSLQKSLPRICKLVRHCDR
jgi:hypothetical protein